MTPLVEQFRQRKAGGHRLAALTAYDYPMARILDEAGLDFLLVGDSLGMVVLGHEDTTSVTMADMVRHTGAVARGATTTPVVSDLPIHSYETPQQALEHARELLAAGARAVKLEGGLAVAAQISALTAAGIPVLAHIGMLPQQVREEGGYRIKGRSADEAEALRGDAMAVQEAGAFAVVLEIVIPGLAAEITRTLTIPTIGIGSGEDCDGQILVTHDLVGLFPWFRPKFARPRAEVAAEILRAAREYTGEVRGHRPAAT